MSQPPQAIGISDFDLLGALGSGSYSTVFRAKRKKSKESVAIKIVTKESLSKSSTDALIQEIRILKSMKHKYIVEMFDFTWDAKNIYIIMELCDGDLSSHIRLHKQLPESTCKFFLRQLAIALKYMRDHEISHFDLKPHNLLLTRNPGVQLKVADFGFAQHLGAQDHTTTLKGSPLYMAPEILLERRYEASADLWSIGCILYECLFGWAPYRSKTIEELLIKVKTEQSIDLRGATKLTAPCKDLLARLLVHDPAKRIAFGDFFSHEFLDMEHEPTDENLAKAIELLCRAVELDNRQRYSEAYTCYCEGLQFMVPLISAEPNVIKKRQLRENADAYLQRAETIKKYNSNNNSCDGGESSTHLPTLYSRLYGMCASSPEIQSTLKIGRQAELYHSEDNLEASVETYRWTLCLLVPLLALEPRGLRRDLLHKQISIWMLEAERIKSVLDLTQLSDVGSQNEPRVDSEEAETSVATPNTFASCSIQ